MSSIWTLRRSATDTKVTGLCGGIARRWGVDPLLVRVGCVLLALSGGVGIVLYAAGWLLIPVEEQDKRPVDDLFGGQAARWSNQTWVAIVVVACVAAFVLLGSLMPFGLGPAVILAVVWYFGYYRNRSRSPGSTPPVGAVAPYAPPAQPYPPNPTQQFPTFEGPPTPFTEAAQAWQERVTEHRQANDPTDHPTSPPAPYPPHPSPSAPYPTTPYATLPPEATWEPYGPAAMLPPSATADPRTAFLAQPDPVGLYVEAAPLAIVPRHRSRPARRLRLVGLLVMGIVLSGLGVADQSGVAVPVAAYLAAALLVVGLTLVAATWLGRARGILPLGALLLVGVLATSVAGPVASQGWGVEQHTYTTADEIPTTPITKEVGQIQIDLSQVTLTDDTTLTAHVDAGGVTVTVPQNTNVRIQYVLDAGVLTAFGEQAAGGTDLRDTIEPAVADPTHPTLTLVLSADVGKIEVQR